MKVEDERQLADTIVYIARNPLKARPDVTAEGYIWGSARLIFNECGRLYDKARVADVSYRESVRLFKTKPDCPRTIFSTGLWDSFFLNPMYLMTRLSGCF